MPQNCANLNCGLFRAKMDNKFFVYFWNESWNMIYETFLPTVQCAWGQPITGLLSPYQKWNLRGNQWVLGQVRLHYSSLSCSSLDGIFTWLGDKVKPHNENIVLFPSSVSSTKIQQAESCQTSLKQCSKSIWIFVQSQVIFATFSGRYFCFGSGGPKFFFPLILFLLIFSSIIFLKVSAKKVVKRKSA